MMKKILILGLIVGGLFIVSIGPAAIADETISDDKGDVINIDDEVVSSSENIEVDNIDIREVTYSRESKSVILKLRVYGEIEDRGHIDDLIHLIEMDKDIDLVVYTLTLVTSDDEYNIFYVNNICNLSYYSGEKSENIQTFSVDNKHTLIVSFDLKDANEICEYVEAMTMYIKMPDFGIDWENMSELEYLGLLEQLIGQTEELYDDAVLEISEEDDDSDNEGDGDGNDVTDDNTDDTNGDSGQDDSSDYQLFLFVTLVAIICGAGIAVLIWIIRR